MATKQKGRAAVEDKPAKKAAAPAKQTGKSLANWEEELAKDASEAASVEANVGAGGNYLSTRGGILKYKDNPIEGNAINVIVLNHVIENAYYGGARFDPDSPANPVCFAIGKDEKSLAPHEESEEPQHDACEGCPMNEWESADTGRGKACKNIRRLALLTEDALDEGVEDAEAAFIKVPVTSVSNWATYVRKLKETTNRPPYAFITEIKLVPDPKTQFKMQFRLVEELDGEHMGALIARSREMVSPLSQPYRKREEDEAPRNRGRNSKLQRGGAQRNVQKAKPAAKAAPPTRGRR